MNISYDYTFDTLGNYFINKNEYKEYLSKKGIERYLAYRLSKNSKKDPDLYSEKLQDLYKSKWERYNDSCIERVYSDTMTSAQTLISHFYLEECSDEWKHYKKEYKDEFGTTPNSLSSISMDRIMDKLDEYPRFKEIFAEKKENEYKCIRDFMDLYHTIGNYIPVPKYFNSNRAGYFANHDMWDLTLVKINEYFRFRDEKNEKGMIESLKNLLHLKELNDKNQSILNNTKNWLDLFNSWEDFIKDNYLQDYIDKSKKNWPIKDEFKSIHSWENPFPKKEDYLKYFKLLVDTIKARGNKILSNENENETK